MINANFTYSVIKIVLIGLSLLNVMDVFSFLNTLGVRVMSMAVVTGFSRLQTSVDIITPFLLFFILQSPRLNLGYNKKIRLLFCIISVISTILSFSRFLMMVSAASCFLYWMTLKLPRMIKALLFCSCCLFVGVGFIGIDKVEKMIELRFFSQDNFQSDQTRVEQIEALMVEYDQAPFFGAGLGGYAKDHIRDSDLKHSYEVQWVAFLMQLGLIGLCFLMIPLGIISRGLLHFPFSRLKFAFLSLFLLWLLSGFTNPFLISLTSGIVYSLFFLGADIMKSPAEHATN